MLVAVAVVVNCTIVRASAWADDLPNVRLTPGAIVRTDSQLVCRVGYARSVRPRNLYWRRLTNAVYRRYGLLRGHRTVIDARGRRHAVYVIDHLVPLELGGAPADLRNLWPQPRVAAKRKDEVENELHALVCSDAVRLEDAQRAIARDWRTALIVVAPQAIR